MFEGYAVYAAGMLLIYVLARQLERQTLEFYQAAALLAVLWALLTPLFALLRGAAPMYSMHLVVPALIDFAAGLVLFGLLRHFEDTMAAWLLTLVIGGYVFVMIL